MWFSKCEDSCVVLVLLGPHLVDDVSFLCNAGELLDFLKLPLEGSSVELDAGHGGGKRFCEGLLVRCFPG